LGITVKQKPVKLITGFIFNQKRLLRQAEKILTRKFGRIDFESPIFDFSCHTDYYEKEFGRNLKRKFVSFEKLINPRDLAKIKVMTNRIELDLTRKTRKSGPARRVNIDPGYLELAQVILATTKDFTHRIYLEKGIFAEVTLFYRQGSYQAWEWTYPDYRTSQYIRTFNQIRQIYSRQIC
jgi:hypothetical protein